MDIGIIVLVLIAAFFTVALYCMLVATSLSDDEMSVIWDEAPEESESEKQKKLNKQIRIDAWILVLSVALFSAGIVVGMMISSNHHIEATPDTGVVIETIETIEDVTETTNPSIPESEETIHIEETEVVAETTAETVPEAPSEPEIKETAPEVDPDELEMLACVIYQEAGGNGSCDDCRRYVADVVLNRVESSEFPDTIYDVLTAKRQYGEFYWTGIKWPERAKYDVEQEAVARAYRIAEEVLSGQHSKLYGRGYVWQAAHVQGTDGFWCCGHFYGR